MAEMEKNESAAEKAMDNALEFMNRKISKQEQEAFLHRMLFGM